MRKLFLFCFCILTGLATNAQGLLMGTITDISGEPLPGATIMLEKTRFGSMSDPDGFFMLQKLGYREYTVIVSYVGFETIRKTVEISQKTIMDFELKRSVQTTKPIEVKGAWQVEESPMTTTTVNKEQLEKSNLGVDVPFLLRGTPSAVVTSDAGAGIGYTGIRIRGTDPTRINVTINGIPLNDSESQSVYWVDLPDFASSTDRIRIQRGVGSSTNGSGAFGATIALDTRKMATKRFARLEGYGGSFDSFKGSVQAGTGLLKDKFTFEGRYSNIISNGYIDRARARLNSWYLSGGYLGTTNSLQLNVFSGQEETYQAWNGVPIQYLDSIPTYNVSGTEKEGTPYENEVDNYRQTHYQALFKQQLGMPELMLGLGLHYTRGKGYFEQYKAGEDFANYGLRPYYNIDANGDTLGFVDQTDLVRRRWLDNHFYGATYSIDYNPGKWNVSLGGAWNQYKGGHYGKLIEAPEVQGLDKDRAYYNSDATKNDFNVYTKINYLFTNNFQGWLDLQYRNVVHKSAGNDNDLRDVSFDKSFDFFNPKIGFLYKFVGGLGVYGSYAVAHREPNREDFSNSVIAEAFPEPERLYNAELGARKAWKNAAFSANVYHMLYKDQLVLTGQINDIGDAVRVNVPDSYRLGMELEGGWSPTENLRLNGNIAFSQNKIKSFTEYIDNWDYWSQDFENTPPEELEPQQYIVEHGDTDISFSPEYIGSFEIAYNLPVKNGELEFRLLEKIVGEQFIDNSASEFAKLDAYNFTDFQFIYNIKMKGLENVRFNLLLRNIFDQKFVNNAWVYRYISKGYDGRVDDPYTLLENKANGQYNLKGVYPQAGFNFLVGLIFDL